MALDPCAGTCVGGDDRAPDRYEGLPGAPPASITGPTGAVRDPAEHRPAAVLLLEGVSPAGAARPRGPGAA